MSDLNETLAQEAAELINGGEWRDGKWYSDGHRDAWRRALKPASDRIEKLETALRDIIDERGICGHCGQLATGEGKRNFVICDKNVLGFEGPCYWTPQDPKDIARKALEGKDD